MEEKEKNAKGLIKSFDALTHTELTEKLAKEDPLNNMTKSAEMQKKMEPLVSDQPPLLSSVEKRRTKAVA